MSTVSPLVVVLIIAGMAVCLALLGFLLWRWRSGGSTRPAGGIDLGDIPDVPDRGGWLVGQTGPHHGRSYQIAEKRVIVGRDATCFIQIPEEKASRRHCELIPGPGYLQVEDLRSANGTFVNGVPIGQGRMQPGDELRIGSTAFVYQLWKPEERKETDEHEAAERRRIAGRMAPKETLAQEGMGVGLLVQAALAQTNGDVDAAAKQLGVPPSMVRAVMEKTGIEVPRK